MKNPAKASDLSLIEPVISKYKNTSGSLITVLQEIQDIAFLYVIFLPVYEKESYIGNRHDVCKHASRRHTCSSSISFYLHRIFMISFCSKEYDIV